MAYSDELKKMKPAELAAAIAGWREGTENHWLGLMEIERRKSFSVATRSWIAIVVSVAAMLVAWFKK